MLLEEERRERLGRGGKGMRGVMNPRLLGVFSLSGVLAPVDGDTRLRSDCCDNAFFRDKGGDARFGLGRSITVLLPASEALLEKMLLFEVRRGRSGVLTGLRDCRISTEETEDVKEIVEEVVEWDG